MRNIIRVPAKRTNLWRPPYGRDVLMRLIEESDHHCLRDAPFVTPSLFSVFEYLELYSTCFDIERFRWMQTDENVL